MSVKVSCLTLKIRALSYDAESVLYLCGDAHAARNVHTEHNQRVLQVLVVVLTLSGQVKFIAEQAWGVTDTHSPHAVAHTVLVAAELAQPYLKTKNTNGKESNRNYDEAEELHLQWNLHQNEESRG